MPISYPKILLCSLFFICAPPSKAQADSQALSLSDAEQRLVSVRKILISASDIQARQYERQALDNLNLPQLSIVIAGIAYEKQLDFTIPLINQPASADINRSGLRSQVSMLWPLYTGGRSEATQQLANARISEAEAEQRLLQLDLLKRLADLYFSNQMMQQVVMVRQQNVQTIDQHVRRAESFKAQGLITELGLMQANVAAAEANRELIMAQRQQADVQAALVNLLELDSITCLATPLPTPVALQASAASFVSTAKRSNPVFDQLRAKDQQVSKLLAIEEGKRLPEFFFAASYDLNRSATPLTEPDWSVGLGMRYNFISAVDVGSSINAARERQTQLELTREQASADIQLAIESTHRAVQDHYEQFQLLQTDIDLARQHARLQDRAFAEGLATSLEVTDAQLRLAASEIRALNSAFLYTRSLAHLTQLSGQPETLLTLLPALAKRDRCTAF